MELSDFVLLSSEEKKHAVLHEAVLVGKRKQQKQIAFLFQFPGFYVETLFNTRNKGVEEFRMFNISALPQPYLDNISLEGLVN